MVKQKRSVAQLAEQRSPKPQVGGSRPSWPAKWFMRIQKARAFLQNVFKELSKINWPTLIEIVQTIMTLVVVVSIISLFLWSADSFILKLIKLCIKSVKAKG